MSEELNPITREEMFMAAAAGESVDLPDPITREELYLAKAAGEDVETPEPITRKEMYLDEIAQGGGGGGGVTVESLIVGENGTYTAPSGVAYSPVSVDVPSTAENDVNFYDYDGTIIRSYTADEFLELDAFPQGAAHSGLTFQRWNWTFADAQAFVEEAGVIDIYPEYITSDGKTRIYLHLEEPLSGRVMICPNGTVDIDWGDGSEHETVTGTSVTYSKNTSLHNYANAGDYVITLTVTGSMNFYGRQGGSSGSYVASGVFFYDGGSTNSRKNTQCQICVRKIELGANVGFNSYAFNALYQLKSITIPSHIDSMPSYLFYQARSIRFVTIPHAITGIYMGSFPPAMYKLCLPKSVTTVDNQAIQGDFIRVIIPNKNATVVNLNISTAGYGRSRIETLVIMGSYAFQNGQFQYVPSLKKVVLGNVDLSKGAFGGTNGELEEVYILGETVTSIAASFGGINYKLILPKNLETLSGSNFSQYYGEVLDLPESLVTIGNSVFSRCGNLKKLTIPKNVTSIGTQAFSNAEMLKEIHIKPTTPPTLASNNAFSGMYYDTWVMYVPKGTLETYQEASNWSSYADHMVEWDDGVPVQTGDNLAITTVSSATQTDDNLSII